MKGALHADDLDNIMTCIGDPDDIVKTIETGIQSFGKDSVEMSDVMLALTSIGSSLKKLSDAARSCDNDVTQREFQVMSKMTENFKHPKELAYKIGTNIVVNGVDIY